MNHIVCLDQREVEAEVMAMAMFADMGRLEQIYSKNRGAVYDVLDILHETHAMLGAMLIALENRYAAQSTMRNV